MKINTRPYDLFWLVWGLLLISLTASAAQEMSYFSCPKVAYFDTGCRAVIPLASPVAASPAPIAQPSQAPDKVEEPLFTLQTVSPDTPPLMLQLLQAPDEANAKAFYIWHLQRMLRAREVQHLLAVVQQDPDIKALTEGMRTALAPPKADAAAAPDIAPPAWQPPDHRPGSRAVSTKEITPLLDLLRQSLETP